MFIYIIDIVLYDSHEIHILLYLVRIPSEERIVCKKCFEMKNNKKKRKGYV